MTRRDFASLVFATSALFVVACNETKTPTEPAVIAATPTPVPPAGPLGAVHVTLAGTSSGSRHTFTVHIEVRETRGVGIFAMYEGMSAPGTSYLFPNRESGIQEIRIPPGGVGTTDVLVEADENVPCSAGLTVFVRIRSDDQRTASVPSMFDCTTGYWPL